MSDSKSQSESKSQSPWFTPVDTGSLPMTEPHSAPIFDTGPHPEPLEVWAFAATGTSESDSAVSDLAVSDVAYLDAPADADPAPATPDGSALGADLDQPSYDIPPVPVPPTIVPGQYQYLRWWKFALVTLGVWAVSAGVGVGLYYWWFHSTDKLWTNFTVLVWVIVAMVAGLLLSLVERRPMVSAAAIAVMSAPFASGAGAAALYGMYVFGWITP